MDFNIKNLKWTREPESYSITEEKIEIVTKPYTDLENILSLQKRQCTSIIN